MGTWQERWIDVDISYKIPKEERKEEPVVVQGGKSWREIDRNKFLPVFWYEPTTSGSVHSGGKETSFTMSCPRMIAPNRCQGWGAA